MTRRIALTWLEIAVIGWLLWGIAAYGLVLINGRLSAPTLSPTNETNVNASSHRASTVGDAICTMTETISRETFAAADAK